MSWTSDEIYNARNADLPSYFRTRGYDLKPEGNRFYVKEITGLVLLNCTYYNFYGDNEGHNNAVDCLMNVLGLSFNDSIQELLGITKTVTSKRDISLQEKKSKTKYSSNEKKELIMPEAKEGQYRRAFAYLIQTRKIDPKLVKYLVENNLLYEDVRGNCVFVWKCAKNGVVGADKNGTTERRYKGITAGSNQDVGFNISFSKNVEKLLFFESPIELLSFITLKRNSVNKNTMLVSMSGCKNVVVDHHIQCHPNAKVFICTNNDKRGKQFADGYNYETIIPKNVGDWNVALTRQNVEKLQV